MLLLGAVWLAYAAGAVLGSFTDAHIALWALAIPLGMLVAVIVLDVRRPIHL